VSFEGFRAFVSSAFFLDSFFGAVVSAVTAWPATATVIAPDKIARIIVERKLRDTAVFLLENWSKFTNADCSTNAAERHEQRI
jgi:hypothetical protein